MDVSCLSWLGAQRWANEQMSKGRSSFPAPQKEPSSFLLQNGHGVETFSAAKLSKVQDFAQWYYYRISRCLLGGLMLMVKPWHAFFQCVSYKCLHPFHTGVPTQNILYTTNHWIERDTISGIRYTSLFCKCGATIYFRYTLQNDATYTSEKYISLYTQDFT